MRITRARKGQLFLVLGAILIGCDVTEPTERSFTIRIDSFSVPETVSGTDSIPVHLLGYVGRSSCFHFSHFKLKKTVSAARIEAKGTETLNMNCVTATPMLDTVYYLLPPFKDPFLIEILQPDGAKPAKTVRVQ